MTIENVNKNECCGCSLCTKVCAKKCITMKPDHEGFLVPVINTAECTECGLCYKKCPAIKRKDYSLSNSRYYASAIRNKEDLINSSSGGLFIAFAKYVLKNGGYVCGCVWDNDMRAIHICSNKIEDIRRMMGSKYVQSTIENVLSEVKRYIEAGILVLFTGTACQIAAVKALFPNADNLYLVDILCHGVPSPLFFRKYIEHLEKKHGGKVVNFEFRNKKKLGWGSEHRSYYEVEKKGKIQGHRPVLPAYFCSFFYGTNLRESCYRCKYAGKERISDITIGDFWGYMAFYGKYFPDGISIASVNTVKGQKLHDAIREEMSFCDEVPQDKGKGTNTNFYHPTTRYPSRDSFYIDINNKQYKDYIWPIYLEKATWKKFIVSLYGRFTPQWIKKLRQNLK